MTGDDRHALAKLLRSLVDHLERCDQCAEEFASGIAAARAADPANRHPLIAAIRIGLARGEPRGPVN